MTLNPAQRIDRLRVHTAALAGWRDRAHADLDGWTCDGVPLGLGAPWPRRDGVVRLAHPEVSVPDAWPLAETRLDLDLGGEALLTLRFGDGHERFGLDPYHRRFPLRGPRLSIEAEAVARQPFGVPEPDPRVRRARLVWEDGAVVELVRLLELVREAAEALADHEAVPPLLACAERALGLVAWPSRTPDVLARAAARGAFDHVWAAPTGLNAHPPGLDERQRSAAQRAHAQLRSELRDLQGRYPPQGALALSGHAHLDLAWLWPIDETRRKLRRTTATTLALLERHPEFRYVQSHAQYDAWLAEDDPEAAAAVAARVAEGRWEPIGGMWVESDTLMPTGESLARQLLYGQRAFERRYGRLHRVGWLPDCFGFAPALPQLYAQAGIDAFFTTKTNWNETNRFPHDLFWWEGLDGSRVLTHTFRNDRDAYNGVFGPATALEVWRHYRGKHAHPEGLLTLGYGDGGGGTSAEMLERRRAAEDLPVLPRTRWGRVEDHFADLRASAADAELPVWLGEIYLELHRGTLTSQGRTKRLHRRAERALLTAEAVAALAHLRGGPAPGSLEPRWRELLKNQFHDILPGSSIGEVYVRAERELADVVAAAEGVAEAAMRWLADAVVAGDAEVGAMGDAEVGAMGAAEAGATSAADATGRAAAVTPSDDEPHATLLVVNPELRPRPLRVHLPPEAADAIPGAQRVAEGALLSGAGTIPGLAVVTLRPGPAPAGLTVSERHLENDLLRVEIGDDGSLARVFDKRAGREVLAGRGNQLWAYLDLPRAWDAWDVDAGYREHGEEIGGLEACEVVEGGPHRAAVRLRRRFRDSAIDQTLRLWANSARLEFATRIDWRERHLLLKARFPLAVRAESATFETAFGVVRRPTHANTSWDAARFEVAGHRFADLAEPGYGVALLNDGRYGHHALPSELGLTLLRSPTHPDPHADEGQHAFTYALLPHQGDWLRGGVLAEAEDLNAPLRARPLATTAAEGVWQPLTFDPGAATGREPAAAAATGGMPANGLPEPATVALGALKPAEDGRGLVLRVYEPQGARGPLRLRAPAGWRVAGAVDLLERRLDPPIADAIGPFQVRTWRLEPDG
jgi:alpha-mannosidase